MTVTSNRVHRRANWRWPTAYSTSLADPLRWPKLCLLRSSCGHLLGVGLIWRRQRYIAWKACR